MNNKTVVIGVGQSVQQLNDNLPVEKPILHSAVDLAATAVKNALSDTGLQDISTIVHGIDCLAWVRSFCDSMPENSTLVSQVKGAVNPAAALAKKSGLKASHLIHTPVGGDVPQNLVNEMAARIGNGEIAIAVLAGGEAIANEVFAVKNGIDPKWADQSEVEQGVHYEDRGPGFDNLLLKTELDNGLWDFLPAAYSLFENAWRIKQKLSMKSHMDSIASLFGRFIEVARFNPYSMFDSFPSKADLTSSSRMLTSTYSALHCSREKVNQAAAIILCSESKARELGVDPSRWVYFSDGANVADREILRRENFIESASMQAVSDYLFKRQGFPLNDIDVFDIYSCFPIAVEIALQSLGLDVDDKRELTVTGGLPFFGGAGNNYSMHGIASMVERLRVMKKSTNKEASGLVIANGGVLSKHAMGIYSTLSPEDQAYTGFDKAGLIQKVDAQTAADVSESPEGNCELETWTRDNRPRARSAAIVVGRLSGSHRRFVAQVSKDDLATISLLDKNTQSFETMTGSVTSSEGINTFTIA